MTALKFKKFKIEAPLFFFCISAIVILINIFRLHPENFFPTVQVFWLDFLLIMFMPFFFIFNALFKTKYSFGLLVTGIVFLIFLSVPVFYDYTASFGCRFSYLSRIFFYCLLFLFVFYPWLKSDVNAPIKYANILYYSLPLMFAIVIFQLFFLGFMTDFVHFVYGTEKLRTFYGSSRPRGYGSFFNANWFGVYIVIVSASLFYLLHSRNIGWFRFLIGIAISLCMLIMSGSRTALIGLFVLIIVIFFLSFSFAKLFKYSFFFLLPFTFVFVYFVNSPSCFSFFKRFIEFFQMIMTLDVDSLAPGRVEAWICSVNKFIENPFLGAGINFISHNSYLTTINAFGFLGLFSFFVYIFVIMPYGMKNMNITKKIYAIPVLTSFFVMSLAADFLYTTQVFILVIPFFYWTLRTPRCFIRIGGGQTVR